MKVFTRLSVISVLVSLLTACGGGHGHDASGTVQLENNNSSLSIREFNLSPSYQSSWGANQLFEPLLAGLTFEISSVPVADYDVRARVRGEFSNYSTYVYDIPVFEGDFVTVISSDSSYTGSVKIVNGTTDSNITAIYISPSTSTTWGGNQLEADIVPAGSVHLYEIDSGLYDVKIVWDAGPDTIYYDRSIESLSLLTLTTS